MKKMLYLMLFISVLLGVACSDDGGDTSDNQDSSSGTDPSGDASEVDGSNGRDDSSSPDDTSNPGDTSNNTDSASDDDSPGSSDTGGADDTSNTGDGTGATDTSGIENDTSASEDTAVTGGTDVTEDTNAAGDTNVTTDTSDTSEPVDTTSGMGDTNTSVDTEWDTIDTTGEIGCVPVPCGNSGPWACGDCLDNDSDGRFDAADPDCLGPCDNNESGFVIDIDGSAPGNCGMDCYFDDNNGNGDDECLWDFRCDPDEQHYKEGNENAVCAYEPEKVNKGCDTLLAAQPAVCNQVCEPLVPNGCDCWGCCLLQGSYRFIGTPGCALDNLDSCDPCTPVPPCNNPCGECELCIGETTLDPECLTRVDTDVTVDTDDSDDPGDTAGEPNDTDTNDDPGDPSDTSGTTDTEDGPVYLRCPDGRQPCGQPGDAACTTGYYCITGCCAQVVLE